MTLDIIIALVVALGFYLGFQRGLIKTIFDTLSLFVGLLAALKLSPFVINIFEGIVSSKPLALIIGVVVTFIAVMALIRFVGKKLEDVLEAANINIVNKIAGGALQGLFFALLLSLLLGLMTNLQVLKPDFVDQSKTYPLLKPLPEKSKVIFEKAKPIFQNFWTKTVEAMDTVKKKGETMQE